MRQPKLHSGSAGTKWFLQLPDHFHIATVNDFYIDNELRKNVPFLLLNSNGEYEAYRTNIETWEDCYLSCVCQLCAQKRVFIYDKG